MSFDASLMALATSVVTTKLLRSIPQPTGHKLLAPATLPAFKTHGLVHHSMHQAACVGGVLKHATVHLPQHLQAVDVAAGPTAVSQLQTTIRRFTRQSCFALVAVGRLTELRVLKHVWVEVEAEAEKGGSWR